MALKYSLLAYLTSGYNVLSRHQEQEVDYSTLVLFLLVRKYNLSCVVSERSLPAILVRVMAGGPFSASRQ
ncbi:hypothetical protein [Desulfosporosinus sp.]|uniref:hypothetical protein n=1 Tax=Desulfosporosinus sp. TaxID=157907 RepID=UPI002611AAD1|nr:hypothetical protein [Desulfosporosinus sp.]